MNMLQVFKNHILVLVNMYVFNVNRPVLVGKWNMLKVCHMMDLHSSGFCLLPCKDLQRCS